MVEKDKIKQHKKWTQQFNEASREVSSLAESPDKFFTQGKDDAKKWGQAAEKLNESLAELNRLLDDDTYEEETNNATSAPISPASTSRGWTQFIVKGMATALLPTWKTSGTGERRHSCGSKRKSIPAATAAK